MKKLEIVFDTETTGIDPNDGHRVVEIGCVELDNLIPTGRTYHTYVNPERDMPAGAFEVHGLSTQFLSDKPLFSQIVDDFLEFIGDSALIAHNASFDFRFINWELDNLGRAPLPDRRKVDSLKLAQRVFPGQSASLDALCRRFEVDLSARAKHGALLDAELLAEVYLNLKGGRQKKLELVSESFKPRQTAERGPKHTVQQRQFAASDAETARHQAFIKGLPDAIWAEYLKP